MAIFVVTAARVRHTSVRAEGFRFHLVHSPRRRVAGPGIVSLPHRGPLISDRVRTIVDALCRPSWIGGAMYLYDALSAYRTSSEWDEVSFAECMRAIGSGAAYKRLVVLAERKRLAMGEVFADATGRRTSGVIDLDPTKPSEGRIRSSWGIRLNADLEGRDLPEDETIQDDFIEGVDDPDDP